MNTCRRLIILAFIVVVSSAISYAQTPNVEMISADELKAKVTSNLPVTIIDVRSSEGFAASTTTVKGSIHFKLRHLKYRLAYPPFKDLPKDREIVTYCACPKDESTIVSCIHHCHELGAWLRTDTKRRDDQC